MVMMRLVPLLLLCGLAMTSNAQTNCNLLHDSNDNGFVDIEDFLSILGLFGDQDSDGDGVYDSLDNCTDPESCNFMIPSAPLCTFPDAIGDCQGNCPLDANGDGVCDVFSCGSPFNFQGYDYETVYIGEQCWFAENLQSESYANGDPIPSGLSASEWANVYSGAVAVYGEEPEWCGDYSLTCDPVESLEQYGRLYNGFAVQDSRGLCPSGWHVPTDQEWMTMEMALGMSASEVTNYGGRGTDQGSQMKMDYGWADEGNGTNSSGFSGSPGGLRQYSGYFEEVGITCNWWSSSGYSAMYRRLWNSLETVDRTFAGPEFGFSVRCLQDPEEGEPDVLSSVIGECSLFASGPNATWTHVITLTTPNDANSSAAQTLFINVTALPEGGESYRVVKTVANGNWFMGDSQLLSLGINAITVNEVSFNRSVKIQFSSGDIEFDALSVNDDAQECE